MNFPIILIEGSDIYYEDLIILINERVKHYESLHYRESKVDEMFRNQCNNETLEKIAYDINPSFKSDMIAMYFESINEFTAEDYVEFEKEFGITVPDEDTQLIATVGDAVNYIEKALA